MSTHHKKKSRRPEQAAVLLNTPVPTNPGNPPANGETDPVFTASEAAQFEPGDKAKLDNAASVAYVYQAVATIPVGPPGPPGPAGGITVEADPVFQASEAAQLVPGDKAKIDGAVQRASAGELYSCFGIFDGGNLTNGVRVGGNQVDLQLYNAGQTVVVLSAGQKQLIGYADYANPVPTVAAGWADGVLRDSAGNAFSTGAYSPANPGHWAGSGPATMAQALDIIAAILSNNGANPIG